MTKWELTHVILEDEEGKTITLSEDDFWFHLYYTCDNEWGGNGEVLLEATINNKNIRIPIKEW